MVDDDVKTENKPVSPFAADGDSKVGETAAEHEAAPDPAQPATYESLKPDVPGEKGELDQPAAVPTPAPYDYWGKEEAAKERENPVTTEGTTEVSNEPAVGYQFADPNDPIRQRYAEMERKKDEDIAELVKMGDGKPKV